jgi:hypothetical protein
MNLLFEQKLNIKNAFRPNIVINYSAQKIFFKKLNEVEKAKTIVSADSFSDRTGG